MPQVKRHFSEIDGRKPEGAAAVPARVGEAECLPPGADPYDQFAYPGFAYANTHPNRLATMAILHGLTPAPVECCRVLEMACGDGGNLIPMAYAIPGSEFVGFDLARSPVARAQARIRELGLENARVFASNVLDVGTELGTFDYIVAHGFYAWAPESVRDRLLALCGELLAPQGVAFVSYNAMPGSHLRLMLRDMMLYGAEGIEGPEERVRAGLDLLEFTAASRPENDIYRALIERELKRIEKRQSCSSFHDELSQIYHPVHFAEFAAHAQRHGLQYLSEAVLPPPSDPGYRFEVRKALEAKAPGDFLRQEQLLDFLRVRTYRETLLCRAGCSLRRDFAPEDFKRLRFASRASVSPAETPAARVFTLPSGSKMESNHPAVVALLGDLSRCWPQALSWEGIAPRLAEAGFVLDSHGAALLMRLAVAEMIELRAWTAPLAASIAERPRASACSRQEGRLGPMVTTLLHFTLQLEDPKARHFLQLLDGCRDRSQLLEAMRSEFPQAAPAELEAEIGPALLHFHSAAILEA